MPSFTVELWRVIEFKPDEMSLDEWLGMNEYPIFDPDYREGLNGKIRDHFMYQEIGHETIEQFRFSMRRKLNEIMPLYNELYKTTQQEFDPLSTIDIRTVSSGTQLQTSEGAVTNETDSDIDAVSRNVSSAFPQVMLAGNKDYATSGADSNSQTKTTGSVSEDSSAESNAVTESDSRTSGYQGNPAQLLQAYRAAILNVDMLVIAELDELFMMVWNNGDSYTETKGRFYL